MSPSIPESYRKRSISMNVRKTRPTTFLVTVESTRTYKFDCLTPEKAQKLQQILNWFPGCCVTWMRARFGFTLNSPSSTMLDGLVRRFGKDDLVEHLHNEYRRQFGNTDAIWSFLKRLDEIQTALTFVTGDFQDSRQPFLGDCVLDETLSERFLSALLNRVE